MLGSLKTKKEKDWDYIYSGSKYIGQWKNGKETGHGIKLYFDGRVEKGLYENGSLIEK